MNLLLYESIPLVRDKIMVYLKEHGQLPVKIKKSDGWLIRFSLNYAVERLFLLLDFRVYVTLSCFS